MAKCPVCGSETGDKPVCPVCGFDITCDYERFPTLGPGIPRDLKTRALQRIKDVKSDTNDTKKAPEPTPKPADVPPVSLLSQAEIRKLAFRKGLYAFLFLIVALFFMMFLMMSIDNASQSGSGTPDSVFTGTVVTAGLLVLFFALLKKTHKKMRPDEWVWKKQGKGQWIVRPKENAGTGKKKKTTKALLLFSFGWLFGLHAFYLDGFGGGALYCIFLYGGAMLVSAFGSYAEKMTSSLGSVLSALGGAIVLIWAYAVYFAPMIRIMGMPPEFDKGEF